MLTKVNTPTNELFKDLMNKSEDHPVLAKRILCELSMELINYCSNDLIDLQKKKLEIEELIEIRAKNLSELENAYNNLK